MDGPSGIELVDRSARFVKDLDAIDSVVNNKTKGELIKAYLSIVGAKLITEEKASDFDLEAELDRVRGPLVEIAGPTPGGYDLVNTQDLKRPLVTSNIKPGLPIGDTDTGEFFTHWLKVDFQADSRRLPLKDGSVGALFGNCLSHNSIEETVSEASRVLEPGEF